MLNKINQYKLDTHLSDYSEDSYCLFSQDSYDLFESWGIKRQFKGEEFYHLKNNIFIGRECPNAIIATIDNIIYKICLRFHTENDDDCIACRNSIMDYLGQYMSQDMLNNPKVEEFTQPDFRLLTWSFVWGNLELAFNPEFDISYIITSKIFSRAERLDFFDKLLDTHQLADLYVLSPHKL